MRILKTGSPTIVIERQCHFTSFHLFIAHFSYIAKFLQCFIASENSACSLFTDATNVAATHDSTVNTVYKLI